MPSFSRWTARSCGSPPHRLLYSEPHYTCYRHHHKTRSTECAFSQTTGMKQERFCRYGTVRDKHERGWVLFLPPRLAMFTVLAQEDDNSMPQQRGEGTFYISVALERSRHIAWFETVNIMNLRSHFAKHLLHTCGKSTSIFQEATATPTMAITSGEMPRVEPQVRRKGEAGTLFGRLMSSDGYAL